MRFWLGLHHPEWLERARVPSMVSFRALRPRKSLPRAVAPWVQDSGGFTELDVHGRYTVTPQQFAAITRRHASEIGGLEWAAIQDWMCEERVLARTGLSVAEHQRRTVESLLDLRELAPDLPWIPVLQGRVFDDYRRHVDAYGKAGVDLQALPIVGLGTVCRRQHTQVAVQLIEALAGLGLQLHCFGLKMTGIVKGHAHLASSDSMAWSLDGRLPKGGRCSPTRSHKSCNNCLDYALAWRLRLLGKMV